MGSFPQVIHMWPELEPQIYRIGTEVHTGAVEREDKENGAKEGVERHQEKRC